MLKHGTEVFEEIIKELQNTGVSRERAVQLIKNTLDIAGKRGTKAGNKLKEQLLNGAAFCK